MSNGFESTAESVLKVFQDDAKPTEKNLFKIFRALLWTKRYNSNK